MANKTLYIKNSFTFNGKCSRDYGLVVTRFPDPIRPKRKGEAHDIPNRSGRVVDESDEYENYTQPYVCKLIATDGRGPGYAARALADWLLTSKGYCRLEDDAEPDVYRLARFAGPLDIASINDDTAEVTLEFDCQPKRYFKSGEESFTFAYDKATNTNTLFVSVKENWKDITDMSGIIVYGYVKPGESIPSPLGSFWRNGSKLFDFEATSIVNNYFEGFISYRGGAGEVRVNIPKAVVNGIEVYYSEDIEDFQFNNRSVSNHDRMPNARKAGGYYYDFFTVYSPATTTAKPLYDITTTGATSSSLKLDNASYGKITVQGDAHVFIDAETYDIKYAAGHSAAGIVDCKDRTIYKGIPVIESGGTVYPTQYTLSSDGSIVVKITPRWWTL